VQGKSGASAENTEGRVLLNKGSVIALPYLENAFKRKGGN
jgi:hypothetical protein